MTRPWDRDVVILGPKGEPIEAGVSGATYRWATRDCVQAVERRVVRKPFAATLEKSPSLIGTVLRITARRR